MKSFFLSRHLMLFAGCSIVMMGLTDRASSQGGGILKDATRDPKEIASEALDNTLLTNQAELSFATCYTGYFTEQGSTLNSKNGQFSFVGFYARKRGKNGEERIRIWSARDAAEKSGIFMPLFATSDRLMDGSHWHFTRSGKAVKKLPLDEEHVEHYFRDLCIDSRLTIHEWAYGFPLGKQRTNLKRTTFSSINLDSAERKGKYIQALVTGKRSLPYACYLTLDPAVEYRPVRHISTHKGEPLARDESNAQVINQVKWKKVDGDRWIGESGRNIQYGNDTQADHSRELQFVWKAAWWFDDDVKEEFFDPKLLTSRSSEMTHRFRHYIEAASKVENFNKSDQTLEMDER